MQSRRNVFLIVPMALSLFSLCLVQNAQAATCTVTLSVNYQLVISDTVNYSVSGTWSSLGSFYVTHDVKFAMKYYENGAYNAPVEVYITSGTSPRKNNLPDTGWSTGTIALSHHGTNQALYYRSVFAPNATACIKGYRVIGRVHKVPNTMPVATAQQSSWDTVALIF